LPLVFQIGVHGQLAVFVVQRFEDDEGCPVEVGAGDGDGYVGGTFRGIGDERLLHGDHAIVDGVGLAGVLVHQQRDEAVLVARYQALVHDRVNDGDLFGGQSLVRAAFLITGCGGDGHGVHRDGLLAIVQVVMAGHFPAFL
jgi:hypothetical protein